MYAGHPVFIVVVILPCADRAQRALVPWGAVPAAHLIVTCVPSEARAAADVASGTLSGVERAVGQPPHIAPEL